MEQLAVNVEALEKSKGHLAWVIREGDVWEYFVRGGEVYRAPASAPVMTDGYRCGRWECPDTPWHRESLRKLVAGWADKIIGAL